MPRLKKPHPHTVDYLPADPTVPLDHLIALYTRLSDDDSESVSHAHQEEVARAWANANDYQIVAVYRDWRTGFDANRLGLRRLIDDAHSGKHAGVLFYDHYRAHRGVSGAYPLVVLHAQLPTYQFLAAVGSYEIDHVGIWAGISGLEAATTRRRSTEQRRYRAKLGQMMQGRWPYWLDRDPESRAPIVVPERAQALLNAIRQYADATPIRAVVAWLNANAPQAGPAAKWTNQRFRQALRNPALYGRYDYARRLPRTVRRDGELVTVGYDPNPRAVPLAVPPLVHETELERTECRLAGGCKRDDVPAADSLDRLITSNGGKAAGRPYIYPHPLRKRVICGCGWRMVYAPNHYKGRELTSGMLVCARTRAAGNSIAKDYPPCDPPRRAAGPLWKQVRAQFIDAVEHSDQVIHEVQRVILAEATGQTESLIDESAAIDTLTRELDDLDQADDRLYQRFDRGLVSEGVYRRESQRLEARRRVVAEAKRSLLEQRRILERAEQGTLILKEALVGASRIRFDDLSPADWVELFDGLVSDVVLDARGGSSLHWRQEARVPPGLPSAEVPTQAA
jgi:DNA invertase Pin-like site-specific DNA recombinase